MLDAAAFHVIRAEDDLADLDQRRGLRAHRAGLERDIERIVLEVFAPQFAAGHLDGEEFCMGGRIAPLLDLVMVRRNGHPIRPDNGCGDGHFTRLGGDFGDGE